MDNKEQILIQVAVRPPQTAETQKQEFFDLISDGTKTTTDNLGNFNNQYFFSSKDTQHKIYAETTAPFIKSYLDGYDISLVKYGHKNIFYENECEENNSDKTDNESENEDDFDVGGGIVHKFIKHVCDILFSSKKDFQHLFSIGWTEINEQNQLLDLLNGNGLVQCFSMLQLFEAITVGLSNRNNCSNHNILSIMLEQQWINDNGLPEHKLSTINFCDLNYGTDKIFSNNNFNNFVSEPKDLPTNFYSNQQPPVDMNYYNNNSYRANYDPSSSVLLHQQSHKLLKNAEILFSKLNLNEMNDNQRKEIEEWMFLKTECDNYIPPPEMPPFYVPAQPPAQQTSLLPILEMDETNDENEDENDDNIDDSDSGSYIDINDQSNLFEKIADKINNFHEKTDELVLNKCQEYFQKHPKVLSSANSNVVEQKSKQQDKVEAATNDSLKSSSTSEQYLAKSGRRRSIRDNTVLNSEELNMIRKAAAATSDIHLDSETVKETVDNEQLTKLDDLKKLLKKTMASIDATKLQIKEVDQTITLKRNLITDLIENNTTRTTAKYKCNKKKGKLEAEYEKCKKQLSRGILAGKSPLEIQKLREATSTLEQRLLDLTSINQITNESSSNKKVKQLHKSLQQSKKQLEILTKVLKKEMKHKEAAEKEITSLRFKKLKAIEGDFNNENKDDTEDDKLVVGASSVPSSTAGTKINDSKTKIRDVNARISHLDEILKEKSSNLQLFFTGAGGGEKESKEKESLRHEIRNLRRTREVLREQSQSLNSKLKREKMLTELEQRKMLECAEAIEAIDVAIEMKNEMICGHKSIDTDEKLQNEKGERLLMARLNKLTVEEMRILLYKYFQKVIDLTESSRKVEQNLISLEREKEAWEWREKILTNAIRQARLESERNLVIQQKNHETRLNLLLRHFANETANSSLNESSFDATTSSASGAGSSALPDYGEMNIVKATKRHQYHQQHSQLHHQTEIDQDFKNKLFTKFHVFTRYQQGMASSSVTKTQREGTNMIPHENLKQLKEKKSSTKVTRQKNKLIIQHDANHNN
ncbi:unnamed protein product [Diamesa tonsa]